MADISLLCHPSLPTHGGYFTIMSPIVAEFFGLNAHGVLFGIVAFSGTIGGAIGPILAGYIFDVTAGYGLAFWLVFSAFHYGKENVRLNQQNPHMH